VTEPLDDVIDAVQLACRCSANIDGQELCKSSVAEKGVHLREKGVSLGEGLWSLSLLVPLEELMSL